MAKGKYHNWLTPEGLLKLEGWKRDGLSNEQIANNIGIKRQTFQDWIKKYDDISDALKKGREVVRIETENALFKSCKGFFVTETREEIYSGGGKKVTKITKYIPPSVPAIIFALKNLAPDKWKNNVEVDNREALQKLDALVGGINALAIK